MKPAKREGVLPLLDLVGVGTAMSGERPAVREAPDDVLEALGDHSRMELARGRGVCVLLSDEVDEAGLREQTSAWLMADGTLVFTAWKQDTELRWLRGQSFSVGFGALPELIDLLARNGL